MRSTATPPALAALAAVLAAAPACDPAGDPAITIRFAPVFGDQPFRCGVAYDGVGLAGSTVEVRDFRLYVSEVALIAADGARVPVNLADDGRWQYDGVALLDFEDDSGACRTGSADTNLELRGTAPAGDYTGLVFTLGLPAEHNHLDAATAPAPFNAQGLWWSWAGGYKYMRLDLQPSTQEEFFFHLGATACDGTVAGGFTCAHDNLAAIVLDGFDPARDEVVVDAAAVFAGVDVDRIPDGTSDSLPGCMAFPGDPECTPMLASVGLTYLADAPAAAAQQVFRARPR